MPNQIIVKKNQIICDRDIMDLKPNKSYHIVRITFFTSILQLICSAYDNMICVKYTQGTNQASALYPASNIGLECQILFSKKLSTGNYQTEK